jgi:hypothetical protein
MNRFKIKTAGNSLSFRGARGGQAMKLRLNGTSLACYKSVTNFS